MSPTFRDELSVEDNIRYLDTVSQEENLAGKDCHLPDGESCWIRVGKSVLYIRQEEDQVFIEAYREGNDGHMPFGEMRLF